ncbi:MAG: NnrU family protein [Alphaproteobacteria bacterium]
MLLLIVGLVLFLGIHSIRIASEGWRTDMIARHGDSRFKLCYTLMSVVGLVLIVVGYGLTRQDPVAVWSPPTWGLHLTWVLTFLAFLLFPHSGRPAGPIKAVLHHPMVIGVALWALGHLFANGTLADLFLFGGFLGWALMSWRAAVRRDTVAGTTYTAGPASRDIIPTLAGIALWLLFFFLAHEWLFRVSPRG